MKKQLLLAGLSGLLCLPANAGEFKFNGYLEAELRYYPNDALFDFQSDEFASAAAEVEAYWASDNEKHSVRFKPFGRITTAEDGNRDHADIREFYYNYAGAGWQVEIGINKVYWGVAESAHLVDIINQTDAVESFNGEEKLGQPMISLGFEEDWGNLDLYVLPYFRERKFAAGDERNQLPIPIDYDKTLYESDDGQNNIDYAVRWSHYFGDLDVGISYFNGTSREAIPVIGDVNKELTAATAYTSYYQQLQQVGLELQYIWEDWAFKLEGTAKQEGTGDYNSAVTGFEYTLSDVNFSGIDIGLLAEYMWNDRGDVSIKEASLIVLELPADSVLPPDVEAAAIVPGEFLSPFDHDVFLGTRFTMNDVDSTDFIAGIIYDLDKGTSIASFEGGTRFGDSLRVTMNVYFLTNVPKNPNDSSFYYSRNDDQIELKAQWYF
ncbi:MAG: hypothetical protein HRU20_14480 [Pseudomonadales bacterium]|nr:hypothetical protein [Pseudomonadales bacterium]